MDLGLSRNFRYNPIKNEIARNFVKELNEAVNSNGLKLSQKQSKRNEKGILDEIQEGRNVSTISKNKIKYKTEEILSNLANETKESGDLYFVSSKSSKMKDTYVIYKYQDSEENIIRINGERIT